MADQEDSDEDCIDDDNSSDLEDGELEVLKAKKKANSATRKIFPDVDDDDDCEGIDDSDEEEEQSLDDDEEEYAGEDDDDSENPKKDDDSENSQLEEQDAEI